MSHVLTLVASPGNPDISKAHIKEIRKLADFYNLELDKRTHWLMDGRAVDLGPCGSVQSAMMTHLHDVLADDKVDVFCVPIDGRRKKLLIADMDSTIIEEETLDELAAYAGIKEEIAAITCEAMEGRLDFHEALHKRVGLLEGLEEQKLQETLERMKLSPGADALVKTMAENNATCVLVSGGFTFFTGAICKRAGFHHHHGNALEIEGGKLTGKVIEPILDQYAKVEFLKQHMQALDLGEESCLAVGDGANDIPMLKTAGLGIGYRPKPAVQDEIKNNILHGNLIACLYAQGYRDEEING